MSACHVSVIIPAFRAGKTIRRAIDSVLAQTYSPAEVLVVDDGSPDNLAPVLEGYPSTVSLIRKQNAGAASARNRGIELAKGDLIAFLDADDYWSPQKLARHVEILKRYEEVGLTCSRFHVESTSGDRVATLPGDPVVFDSVLRPAGNAAFTLATQISTITVVARRSMVGTDRFPTDLKTGEDRHMWVRLVSRTPVYFLQEPLATAVEEPGSLSRSNLAEDCANMLRVIDAFRDLLGPAAARRWEAMTYRRLAGGHLLQGMPRGALRAAAQRLSREPASAEGWWVLAKSILQLTRGRFDRLARFEGATHRCQ